jgi:hypothetical protein
VFDEARSIKSRNLLNGIMDDIKRSEQRLSTTQDRFLELEDNISSIGNRILSYPKHSNDYYYYI